MNPQDQKNEGWFWFVIGLIIFGGFVFFLVLVTSFSDNSGNWLTENLDLLALMFVILLMLFAWQLRKKSKLTSVLVTLLGLGIVSLVLLIKFLPDKSISEIIHHESTTNFCTGIVETREFKTYCSEKYSFEFQYPKTWTAKEYPASSIDYMPDSRTFVAIFERYPVQDFNARVDVYNSQLAIVKRDNQYLKNKTETSANYYGISWTKLGDSDYLTELSGRVYHISGRMDLLNQIFSTFKFSK
ncbi:MAG: hypothetical protein A3J07_03455 [Candidatus Doudnabacteria bacterium RIFCSPLOWO2_02_FULL_49_13]|uniref:Uncharacterized protein n=1 Tax=Candidatus Doudnabacteria bacterium RIFCSPHIGHO2_12_FULL_48_16 TaxID=1817838 RepID=A0A1F5PJD8_9BACT|nr:MAG: hypothetical protein A3B77_02260 [Candidatus Doudnabacteria bacterium RIFCSPHIGHO2_02_FULL_49_24]OGE89979.1 MAG: hypothetical protein A3E29_02600 [Candidatus Doudnabacteria bacterium RIFCSPHIGHO2_12_FULL_48_16]OGE97476.1 MAG: hypothetical protein A2990_02035 [Candidatus Doudnabacteria bacterium RIFCSPLOWO2_01_FULL_49_40]OGF03120.1 MAG: hypothetical protein A3J07_03455 [Candidatus Doudnabacteria bacterium RIFCSPLOWO2_02_FULL_49_13]OGF03728.1 MAG: hypothetical protein A3H14_02020 [Candida